MLVKAKLIKFCACLACISLLACKPKGKNYGANISEWEQGKAQAKIKEAGDKAGWRNPRGGRSWTKEDELNFDAYVMDAEKVKKDIFITWDIPTDCADAAMGLRFIYALSNGLALKYGPYDSYTFADKPMEMLKQAVNYYSTKNITELIYSVDMWDSSQYSAGNFWLLKNIHAVPFRFNQQDGIYYTIQSTIPAKVRELEEVPFTNENIGSFANKFFRFYANTNTGDKIIIDKEVSFKAHPQEKSTAPDFYSCSLAINQPFWENLLYSRYSLLQRVQYNEEALQADKINCPHNVMLNSKYIKQNTRVPQKNDILNLDKFMPLMHKKLCGAIQNRVQIVEEGYTKCFGREKAPECTDDESGLYSTPARDERLATDDELYADLLESNPKFAVPDYLYCEVNMRGDINRPLKPTRVMLGRQNMANSGPEIEDHWAFELVYGPSETLPGRWGCVENDVDLKCLEY